MYDRCNIFVTAIFADPEFKTMEQYLNQTHHHIGYTNFCHEDAHNQPHTKPDFNISKEDEHVKDSVYKILIIKEEWSCIHSTISHFKKKMEKKSSSSC